MLSAHFWLHYSNAERHFFPIPEPVCMVKSIQTRQQIHCSPSCRALFSTNATPWFAPFEELFPYSYCHNKAWFYRCIWQKCSIFWWFYCSIPLTIPNHHVHIYHSRNRQPRHQVRQIINGFPHTWIKPAFHNNCWTSEMDIDRKRQMDIVQICIGLSSPRVNGLNSIRLHLFEKFAFDCFVMLNKINSEDITSISKGFFHGAGADFY